MRKTMKLRHRLTTRLDTGFSVFSDAHSDNYPLIAVLLLGGIPAFFALCSWQENFEYTALRHYSLPIVTAQALVIIIAMLSGFAITKSFFEFERKTIFSVILFFGSALLATIFARSDPSAATALFTIVVIHGLFFMVLSERFEHAWRAWRHKFILTVMIGLTLFTLIVLLLSASVLGKPDFNWLAFGAGVTNVRHLGYYGLALTALAAGSMGEKCEIAKPTAFFLFVGIFLSAWSGSRSALASVVVIIAVVAWFSKGKKRTRLPLVSSVLILAALPLSIILAPHELYGAERLISRLFEIQAHDTANNWSSNRIAIWADTWNGITEQPWLGHGEGQFRHQVAAAAGNFNHPHNAPLQYLYSWGVIGSIALIALLVTPVLNMPEAAQQEPEIALPAIGILAGLGTMSLFDGALYYPFPLMCTMIAFALLHSVRSHAKTSAGADGQVS